MVLYNTAFAYLNMNSDFPSESSLMRKDKILSPRLSKAVFKCLSALQITVMKKDWIRY